MKGVDDDLFGFSANLGVNSSNCYLNLGKLDCSMEKVSVLVIGAGVVGLAVAVKMSEAGHEVIVCERADSAGRGISSRNSGVIHAGLYYPKGSLKAQLCARGRELLYAFCEEHKVAHRRIGKLVVATSRDEIAALSVLAKKAEANGASDVALLSAAEVLEREPVLDIAGALWSPSTGIIDVPQLVDALEACLAASGGLVAYGTEAKNIVPMGNGLVVEIKTASTDKICAQTVVNCAGLGAQKIAGVIRGLKSEVIPTLRMVRGNYFSLQGASPFSHLVYPLPVENGLGIHATLDMAGAVRFGPDVQPCTVEDYVPDQTRMSAFVESIARYYPAISDRQLLPDYVGIRPQIGTPGLFSDFVISGKKAHGIEGLINLFGIESPGLTASFAIAETIVAMLEPKAVLI